MKVTVDPRLRLSYSGFYLEGLRQVLGPGAVRFARTPVRELTYSSTESFDHYVALIVSEGKRRARLVIDFRDKDSLDPEAHEWADIYAKVNCTQGQVTDLGVLPVGPGFGVRPAGARYRFDWPVRAVASHSLRSSDRASAPSLRYQAADWVYAVSRLAPITDYVPATSDPGYVFYVASLWSHANCVEETNPWRAAWMCAASSTPGVHFEGGFVGGATDPQWERYSDLHLRDRVSLQQWIERTQRSVAVFNNPAVWGCHGWKLAQFCALGKAIVSTPAAGPLPADLRHGVDAHIVHAPDELSRALCRIREDEDYRQRLEAGARRYWDAHLRPEAVATKLLCACRSEGGQ